MLDTPTNAYQIANVVIPRGGPKAVPLNMDFSSATEQDVDLSQLVEQARIEYVQTVFIDNADNAAAVTLKTTLTNQRIICPAHSQGYFSILQPNNPVMNFSTTPAANLIVGVQFLNVPVQPAVWKTQ
jgi:hypothetical protein